MICTSVNPRIFEMFFSYRTMSSPDSIVTSFSVTRPNITAAALTKFASLRNPTKVSIIGSGVNELERSSFGADLQQPGWGFSIFFFLYLEFKAVVSSANLKQIHKE